MEIFYNGEWGTVCDDDWDDVDARVVCRQLGLPHTNAAALYRAPFGRGTGPILLDDVRCDGSESSLASCRSRGWYRNDCSHGEDAGVRCEDEDVVTHIDHVDFGKVGLHRPSNMKP